MSTEVKTHTTKTRAKLKKDGVDPQGELAKPIKFTCIQHPELRFMVGGEVTTDEHGKQRVVRRGKWRRFHNTMFIAKTEEEAAYCRSKSYIYEEPAAGHEHYDESFRTRNKKAWDAYQKKIKS